MADGVMQNFMAYQKDKVGEGEEPCKEEPIDDFNDDEYNWDFSTNGGGGGDRMEADSPQRSPFNDVENSQRCHPNHMQHPFYRIRLGIISKNKM